jgi:prolyl-tRNA editing enzyme YbaK/EbsC (Cys-tRNA(Pro) deacylase)
VRSCSDVHNYLNEAGVQHEIVHLPASSRTAERAAGLLGVPVSAVVKSLLFVADAGPVMVLVSGDAKADVAAVSRELGVDSVTLARSQMVLQLTGYRPGAVPPCGLPTDIPVIADPGVFEPDVVYCGGGTTSTMLKIRSADLKALLEPRLAAVAARDRQHA